MRPRRGRGTANPLGDGRVLLVAETAPGNHDRVARLAGVEFCQAIVGQQVETRASMHDTMRLGGGDRHLIGRLLRTLRLQAIGLDQDIGNPDRLKQQPTLGGDNQECAHGSNDTRQTTPATSEKRLCSAELLAYQLRPNVVTVGFRQFGHARSKRTPRSVHSRCQGICPTKEARTNGRV